mgnify:CR=1 FL=1
MDWTEDVVDVTEARQEITEARPEASVQIQPPVLHLGGDALPPHWNEFMDVFKRQT